MTRRPENRGQAAIEPWFATAGIALLLLVVAIISTEVYHQVANIPARDFDVVCNTTMGCTGEPVVGPVVLAIIAAAIIGAIWRFKNRGADERE